MNSGSQNNNREKKGFFFNLRKLAPFLGRSVGFFIKGRRWFNNFVDVIEKEIEERKRFLGRAVVFTVIGIGSLILSFLFCGALLFFAVDYFLQNPPLTSGVLFLFFLISGALFLFVGIRNFERVFSVDFDAIKKRIFD